MNPFFAQRQDSGYTVMEFTTESLMNPLELESIGQAIYQTIEQEHPDKVLIDFSKVKYLSSQAVGIILTVNKKMSQAGGLVLCGVGPQLMQLLKITRLDQILKIRADQKEALAKTQR